MRDEGWGMGVSRLIYGRKVGFGFWEMKWEGKRHPGEKVNGGAGGFLDKSGGKGLAVWLMQGEGES